jgi:hypothetical protein
MADGKQYQVAGARKKNTYGPALLFVPHMHTAAVACEDQQGPIITAVHT